MALKRDKFDDVFSQLVRERTNWSCDYCGRTFHHEHAKLHCSHFKSRRHKSTRYHPYNAFAHCIGCHRKIGEDPYEFTAHAEIVYGEMTIERVARLSCAPLRLKPWQMDELYQHMKSELKRLRELRAAGEIGVSNLPCLTGIRMGLFFEWGRQYERHSTGYGALGSMGGR